MTVSDGPGGPPRPDFAVLADWLEGRLDAERADRVRAAVADGGPQVQSAVAWLQEFLRTVESVPGHPPPPLLRQRLRQHFQAWSEGRSGRPQQLVTIRATLVFDSRVDRPLAQVRGRAGTDGVHLAFRSALADVVVDARMLGDGYARVEGQVLPVHDTRAGVFEATATGPRVTVRVVDGDELGRFAMSPLPLDRYALQVGNGEFALTADLDLRQD